MNKELFYFSTPLEVFNEENEPTKLEGYAMKFHVLSHDRGGYRDTFLPGVFGDSLHGTDGFDVQAYYDHDREKYLARVNNGTLRLSLDDVGLRFSLDLPDTSLGRDIAALVDRGDLPGMSFGYIAEEFTWKETDQGIIREHTKGRLIEVSVVHDPAFPTTELALASLEKWRQERDKPTTPNRNFAERQLKLQNLELSA